MPVRPNLTPLTLVLSLPLAAQSATLEGRVLLSNRQPAQDVLLHLKATGQAERTAKPDAEGRFRFEGLVAGEYRLQAERDGHLLTGKTVRLGTGPLKTDLILPAVAGARVEVESTTAIATVCELGKLGGTVIREFPQSIVAVPAPVLQETASVRLEQGLVNVSGVTPSSSSNYGFFDNQLIRGLNAVYLRDGLSDGPTYMGYVRSLWDVEQLEVLKGPGSSLFGSAGPGGSINLTMKKPRTEAATQAQVSVGSFATKAVAVDSTGALGSSTAYRVIVDATKSDGFRNLPSKTWEAIPSLLWRVNEDHSLLFQVEARHIELVPDAAGIPLHGSSYRDTNGAYPFHDAHLIDVPKETSYVSPFANSTTKILKGALTHTWTPTKDFSWRSVAAYTKRDLDFDRSFCIPDFDSPTGTQRLNGRYLRDQQDRFKDLSLQTGFTWTVATGYGTHHLQGGLDLFHSDITTTRRQAKFAPMPDAYNPSFPEAGADLGSGWAWIFDRAVTVRQEGLYLADQLNLGDHWKLRVSVRQDHYRMTDDGSYNNQGNSSFTATLNPTGQFYLPRTGLNDKGTALVKEAPLNTDERFTNGQLGLVYQPIPQTSFFAGAAWGRMANLTTEDPRTAALPESNRQVELGNRTTLLDGKLSLTTALFKTVRFNAPTISLVAGSPVVVLIPEQRVQGLDVDCSATPLPGWFVLAAAAWMDPVYTEPSPSDLWLKDQTLIGVPRQTLRLWTSFEAQNGAVKGLGAGFGLRHRSEVKIALRSVGPGNALVPLPAYDVLDAALFYRRAAWELQLNAKNLTDKTAWAYGIINAAVPVEGRNLSLDLKVRF